MTMFLAPYTAIADIDGSPLDAGFIYFGEYGKDPESFPVEVFWDEDFTVPAAQPIRTRNGYPVRNGSPTKVYLKTAQHSIVIRNRNSAFIFVDFKHKGLSADFIVDASGKTQQEINDFGGAKWWNKPLGYDVGSTVKLENGDIVKSTVAGNTVDPNVDMTGWVYANNAEIAKHAAYVPNGGGSVGVIGGTFRGFAEGINFIVDSAHDKFGFTAISKFDNYTVRVSHDAGFSKVGTLVITADETLTSMGVIAGASVGLTYSDIKIIAPLYVTIKGDGTITKVSPLFAGSVMTIAGNDPAGGFLRFEHPLKAVAEHQSIACNRSFVDNVARPQRFGVFNNDGGTYTQINVYQDPPDNNVWIKYNGTAFEVAQGINKASFSLSFNAATGALDVTHPAVKTGAYITIPIITPFQTTNRYVVQSVSATVTRLLAYNTSGAVVTAQTTADWSFFFNIKPDLSEPTLGAIPATAEFEVFVGNCYVPIDNLQKVSGGNIWLYGAMHK